MKNLDEENQKIMASAYNRLMGGDGGSEGGNEHEQDEEALLSQLKQALEQAQDACQKLDALHQSKSGNPDLRENPLGIPAEEGGSQPQTEGASY